MRRRSQFLSLAVGTVFAFVLFLRPAPLYVFELKFTDLFYKIRGPLQPESCVVVVGIDEYSLSVLEVEGDTWPWNREIYGQLLRKVFEDGASVVAFDISFTEPGEESGDLYFASTILMYQKVVLGTYLVNDRETYEKYDPRLREKIEKNITYIDYSYRMKNFKNLDLLNPFEVYKIRPIHELFSQGAYCAPYEIGSLDEDGVVRRIPILTVETWAREMGVSSGLFPHMNVIAAALYLGIDPSSLVIDLEEKTLLLGSNHIKFDSSGYMHVWYYGRGEDVFKTVPFYDVLSGRFGKGTFSGKLVLVGYTATAKGLYDLRITPFSNNEPGVYIHATGIQNIVSSEVMEPTSGFVSALIMLILSLFITWFSGFRGVSATIAIFLSPLAYVLVSYVLFLNRLYVATFYPVMSFLIVGSGKVLEDFLNENAEKRRMKEFLYRYVPDEVAEELLRRGQLKLGGEMREVVVLFSDIKGFTSISESKTPEEVVSFLNEYLTLMSEIIRYRYRGTIDKFVGDAIMAVFGAPIFSGDEVERALRCALDMRKALEEFNLKNNVKLDAGIGLHLGPAIVGNIGAPFRMDYTCIGDTVNTASRIEHLTREISANIIVSEDVVERAPSRFRFLFLGEFKVKGKARALRLYELIGVANEG